MLDNPFTLLLLFMVSPLLFWPVTVVCVGAWMVVDATLIRHPLETFLAVLGLVIVGCLVVGWGPAGIFVVGAVLAMLWWEAEDGDTSRWINRSTYPRRR